MATPRTLPSGASCRRETVVADPSGGMVKKGQRRCRVRFRSVDVGGPFRQQPLSAGTEDRIER